MNFPNELKTDKKPSEDAVIDKDFTKNLARLVRALEATQLSDFTNRLSRPGLIIWLNFWAGVVRGFGILIGMTIVVGILTWFLSKLVDFPLIGQYFLELKNILEEIAIIVPKVK